MDVIGSMLDNIEVPKFARIKQFFDTTKIDDVEKHINLQFQREDIKRTIKANQTIGITVGSRGLANLKDIVKFLCSNIKDLGATPIILPSMGSHGGAIAEGQANFIRGLGITEEYVGAEIKASMEVINLGTTETGLEVYYDKIASELDGVIVLGRIKAHTDIDGKIESGLHKMIAVGLGNHLGAQVVHAMGLGKAAPRIISVARHALKHGNIIFGVGLLENAYDETSHIEFIPTEKIAESESELLIRSKKQLPKFLFNDIDVLIVDEIGKNISGNGMDPNIIGRGMIGYKNKEIRINKIVTLDTTKESGSNAFGVGLSDVTTKRIFDKLETDAMYANAVTAIAIIGARIPIAMSSDKRAIQLAIRAVCSEEPENLRIVRIKDTLSMSEMFVSESLLNEAKNNEKIEILSELESFEFDEQGNLF
ncbi:lactate racemase domain-containing protein [Sedimentibacter sp.]|uniref:lactate racemase domain-containing protein n=1 Tax=Sedimentibacter sp. TaxID=1960295 RepID=UPI0028A282F6|nr:lactate racemase domain-containing protein [Sedimentibacter sp.]